MVRRVIFVGIHNKPGKMPLDSSTKTGKIVDQIAEALPGMKVVKTNLFDLEYEPEVWDYAARNWKLRISPGKKDIIVCLGSAVSRAFADLDMNIVSIAHPASRIASRNPEKYVLEAVDMISHWKGVTMTSI